MRSFTLPIFFILTLVTYIYAVPEDLKNPPIGEVYRACGAPEQFTAKDIEPYYSEVIGDMDLIIKEKKTSQFFYFLYAEEDGVERKKEWKKAEALIAKIAEDIGIDLTYKCDEANK